ncbi:thioesterase-like superfamily-domain-containing protein [Phascolomyces articulosus]|uniref:Thioesterase-like superfamily-domain-containing protein n=1 Tax=Phascolomyces articulosus TaxID=60185 RepID=A0AAD5PIC7_9FUNG|nr:thioesterase-like superfamily-domain-containing protein [Phascolomyces articulosus]
MEPPFEFDKVTENRYLGDLPTTSVYSGYLNGRWAARGIILSGYLASTMTKVAMQQYPGRHPINVNTFYVNPGTEGPFIVELEKIKGNSKGMCTYITRLKQLQGANSSMKPLDTLEAYNPNDYVIKNFAVINMSGAKPEQGYSHPSPEKYKTVPIENMVQLPSECEGDTTLRMYHDINRSDSPHVNHYAFEFADGRPVDNLALVYFFDMYMDPFSPLMNKNAPDQVHKGWKPTLHYEVQFKNPIKKPIRRAYLVYTIPNVIHGRFDMDGSVYNEEGELLATTRHQLRIIPRKEKQVPASSESKL